MLTVIMENAIAASDPALGSAGIIARGETVELMVDAALTELSARAGIVSSVAMDRYRDALIDLASVTPAGRA